MAGFMSITEGTMGHEKQYWLNAVCHSTNYNQSILPQSRKVESQHVHNPPTNMFFHSYSMIIQLMHIMLPNGYGQGQWALPFLVLYPACGEASPQLCLIFLTLISRILYVYVYIPTDQTKCFAAMDLFVCTQFMLQGMLDWKLNYSCEL